MTPEDFFGILSRRVTTCRGVFRVGCRTQRGISRLVCNLLQGRLSNGKTYIALNSRPFATRSKVMSPATTGTRRIPHPVLSDTAGTLQLFAQDPTESSTIPLSLL